MEGITLKRAVKNDADELLKLVHDAFLPLYRRYNDSDNPCSTTHDIIYWKIENTLYYKIVLGGKTIGGIGIAEVAPGYNYLQILYISPEYQNKGAGYLAIREIERLHPAARWTLETPQDASLNRHLYEKCGYRLTGETEKRNEALTLMKYAKG